MGEVEVRGVKTDRLAGIFFSMLLLAFVSYADVSRVDYNSKNYITLNRWAERAASWALHRLVQGRQVPDKMTNHLTGGPPISSKHMACACTCA